VNEQQYPLPEPAVAAALGTISFNTDGLVAAIAQQHDTGEVLMMAWMNAESVAETLRTGRVCYWSRSRKALWRKGETSGQMQVLKQMLVDCDGDTLLLRVHQDGVACHTGRRNCFFNAVTPDGMVENAPVLVDPDALYGSKR
jgi:phosphoribosyl-AMP cyclohydrolase